MTASDLESAGATPVLLYDGACGLCARSVQFMLAHESPTRRAALRFAALESAFGAGVRARHPEIAFVDSVLWYEPLSDDASRVRVRSAAALAMLAHLGGAWRVLAAIGACVPRPLRDAMYDAIARRRLNMVSRACLLPSSADRHRFLR
ncbi:MAG: DCC1-like thiol-disulfide oxidoreductase family protein [Gemmatimonas sp.]